MKIRAPLLQVRRSQRRVHGIQTDCRTIGCVRWGKQLRHNRKFTLLRQFGEERTAFFQPYKTLFEQGVKVGGGSDHMQRIGSLRSVNPYNPFLGIWTMLTRQPRWTDTPLHPEQIVTREQAIGFYTINNAWLTFEEKEKGSLEAGKLADLIVLDRDLLQCDLDAVKDTQVEQTWLGGRIVYQRK